VIRYCARTDSGVVTATTAAGFQSKLGLHLLLGRRLHRDIRTGGRRRDTQFVATGDPDDLRSLARDHPNVRVESVSARRGKQGCTRSRPIEDYAAADCSTRSITRSEGSSPRSFMPSILIRSPIVTKRTIVRRSLKILLRLTYAERSGELAGHFCVGVSPVIPKGGEHFWPAW
jgi:hypothetical protein